MTAPDAGLLREFFTPGRPLPDSPRLAAAEAEIHALVQETRFVRARPWHSRLPFESRWIPSAWRRSVLGRRVRAALAERGGFPAWPVEPRVERLRREAYEEARTAGGTGEPAPFWPRGKRYAVALSHDLDSPGAYRGGWWKPFAELEESLGARSSWHFCSSHESAAAPVLDELAARGHEIAWHGFRHDYRIAYLAPVLLAARLAVARPAFARWGVAGFRSPFYLRTPALLRGLAADFRYDSSARDTGTELFSPHRREGCATVFPYAREGLLELPLTVPEDLVVSMLTGDDGPAIVAVQREKLDWIAETGGLATVLTHPSRWISLRPGAFAAYREFVNRVAADSTAWIALPREIAAWWRTRQGG